MFCFEIPILLAYILKLTGCGVYNLDIASHVFLAPNFAEVVEAGKCQIRSQIFFKIKQENIKTKRRRRQYQERSAEGGLAVHMQLRTHKVHGYLNIVRNAQKLICRLTNRQ